MTLNTKAGQARLGTLQQDKLLAGFEFVDKGLMQSIVFV